MSKLQKIDSRKPDLETIEALEHLLEQARQGRIRTLVYAFEYSDEHRIQTAIHGEYNPIHIIGMLSRLIHRLQGRMDDNSYIP